MGPVLQALGNARIADRVPESRRSYNSHAMSRLLRMPSAGWIVPGLLGCLAIACNAKVASVTDGGAGGVTGDTSTQTNTATGVASDAGGATNGTAGATGATTTQTGTYTSVSLCVHDAGPCQNILAAGVLPLPPTSSVSKVELKLVCYGNSSPIVQAVTTDRSQIASLYDLTFIGLATQESTWCMRSCPPSFYAFLLTYYMNDGRALNVRLDLTVCGGVTIDGTDCVPHPGTASTIFSQTASLLGIDAAQPSAEYCDSLRADAQ